MRKNTRLHELLFQIAIHIVVFLFFSLDREKSMLDPFKVCSFFNYAAAALLINYVALPRFYKNKNVLQFAVAICLSILLSVLIEEFVFERIFFEGLRADNIQIVWAFVAIVPVVTILTGIKLGWDALTKTKEVERLESLIKESELQHLKSQINPHFLFNNLNNLYSYALEGDSKTPDIILELSGLLRYMLYECKEETVILSKEIQHLQDFINLYKLQIEDRGVIRTRFDMDSNTYVIAPLILIVFIENAFKHSQKGQTENIKIDINIRCTESGMLTMECSNNYVSMSDDIVAKGIGLSNVKKRLELLYPSSHTLDIHQTDTMYKVNLTMQLTE